MPSIALIAEGLTDQIVIERLIEAVYQVDVDDPLLVTYAQPIRDKNDSHHAPHAGWEKVLEYCQFTITDALAANDYVLLHIDTDAGDHINYGLPLTENGVDRAHADLIEGAKAILIRKMGAAATKEALARIVFAIAVHATESWLLLILYGETRLKASFEHLVRRLRKKNFYLKKEYQPYLILVNRIKDREIYRQIDSEHSLGVFLRNLQSRSHFTPNIAATDSADPS